MSYLLHDHLTGTPCEQLLVSNLPFNITLTQFREIFEAYGRVVNAMLMLGRGKGYITYSSIDEARWIAENLDNNIPAGLDTFVNIQFASSGPVPPPCPPPPHLGGPVAAKKMPRRANPYVSQSRSEKLTGKQFC